MRGVERGSAELREMVPPVFFSARELATAGVGRAKNGKLTRKGSRNRDTNTEVIPVTEAGQPGVVLRYSQTPFVVLYRG